MKAVWFAQSQVEVLARYIAELARLGLDYNVKAMADGWKVEVIRS